MSRDTSKFERAAEIYHNEGVVSLSKEFFQFGLNVIGNNLYGRRSTNIYDLDWDVLIVLDACRVDALKQIADEYDFLPDKIDSIISVAGGTPEWLVRTFNKKRIRNIRNTAYIMANGMIENVFGENPDSDYDGPRGPINMIEQFSRYVPTWRLEYDDSWMSGFVSDALINHCRNYETDRTIAHYVQPHLPVVANGYDDFPSGGAPPMEAARRGEISRQRMWSAHVDNLRYVLDDIKTVLNNLSENTVVISADHGEALGEGFVNRGRGWFGHGYEHLRATREVPWVEVSANDKKTRQPDISLRTNYAYGKGTSKTEQLRTLGYLQ